MFQGQKKNDLSAKEFRKKLKLYSKFNNLYFISPRNGYITVRKIIFTKDKPIILYSKSIGYIYLNLLIKNSKADFKYRA